MAWFQTIVRELLGLFVDDGSFAASILVWLAVVGMILPRLGLPSGWTTLLLFSGLASILVESAIRRARRSNRKRGR